MGVFCTVQIAYLALALIGYSMSWQYLFTLWISSGMAVLALVLGWYCWQRRSVTGARPSAFILFLFALWGLAYVLELSSAGLPARIIFHALQYIGRAAIPVVFLAAAMEYGGYEGRVRFSHWLLLMSVLPLVTIGLALTNEVHHLMWAGQSVEYFGDNLVLHMTPGPWYAVHVIYSYGLVLLGSGIMAVAMRRTARPSRRQMAVLLVAFMIVLIWNVTSNVFIGDILQYDLTTTVGVLALSVIIWGVQRYHLFDVIPLAREKLLELMQDGIIVFDSQNRVLDINPAAFQILNLERVKVAGKSAELVFGAWRELVSVLQSDQEIQLEVGLPGVGDAIGYYDLQMTVLRQDGGEIAGRMISLRDISTRKSAEENLKAHRDRLSKQIKAQTANLVEANARLAMEIAERKHTQEALQEEKDLIAHLMDISPIGIILLDRDGDLIFANQRAEDLLGLVVGKEAGQKTQRPAWKITDLDGKELPEEELPFVQVRRFSMPIYDARYMIEKPDGEKIKLSINASPVFDSNGNYNGVVAAYNDITEQVEIEERFRYLATHDSLTELPNRVLFNDRLEHALSHARRAKTLLAVMFLDLDGFKSFNDAFDHERGDELLAMVARRLEGCVRASDTVARVGGDEFVILLEKLNSADDAIPVTKKILEVIAEPFTIQELEAIITASVGISVFPENGETPSALLQRSDAAMYRAKQQGKNRFEFFSPEMLARSLDRLKLIGEMNHALERDQFVLHYQPQVSIETGLIVGFEALIRWNHPEHGLVSPEVFIPLAEETGLIQDIGAWVIRTACRQLKVWQDLGLTLVKVGVNLSERQLKTDEIVDLVQEILEENQVPPNMLELEFTENIIYQNLGEFMERFEKIKLIGVQIAIDDFGSGYTSLNQLSRFPFDTLKIDQAFISSPMVDTKDAVVVSGIISIARDLGMKVIAEGVETREQLVFYELQSCSVIQGWYFHKSLPPEDCTVLLGKGILHRWDEASAV